MCIEGTEGKEGAGPMGVTGCVHLLWGQGLCVAGCWMGRGCGHIWIGCFDGQGAFELGVQVATWAGPGCLADYIPALMPGA